MHALIVPARVGWRWLAEGFILFRRNPPLLSLVVVSYWLMLALLNAVPVIGGVLATILMPALSVLLMNVCRNLDQGFDFSAPLLLLAFRQNAAALYRLGALYLLLTLAILGITALVDGGALLGAMLSGKVPDEASADGGAMLLSAQLGLLLLLPLVMAYWYAPLLVAWHRYPLGKALFFSFFACLRNWRAFLAYSLAVALWSAGVPGLLLGVMASLSPDAVPLVATALSIPLVFVLGPSLIASFYISYREVFVERPGRIDEIVD